MTLLQQLTTQLLEELDSQPHWCGELSSSALSTAVATIALGEVDRQRGSSLHRALVQQGLAWLANSINSDGGWGDTIRSKSNVSTTALCWAAFGAARADNEHRAIVEKAAGWLQRYAGSLDELPTAIARRYGRDRTFSVPILMTLALSGRLGPYGWHSVPALPFELAMFPRSLFGALRLPVVSYALPALIAIGQTIHHHAPAGNPLVRTLRNGSRTRTLALLWEIQPQNGGFLEATPLTSFVTMSLASARLENHPVTVKAVAFLKASVRSDGSWPIDTNLATWVTTLSIKALSHQPELLGQEQKSRLRAWLISQQYRTVHAYTGAAPGGWAWTDLPGGVPDADDTAGALLALHHLGGTNAETLNAVESGLQWLLGLQNSDGGIPTFCRGWGTLPFDRSTPEVTAHALRAWSAWGTKVNPTLGRKLISARERAFGFLRKNQRPNGAFVPLWFGNEHAKEEENPVYGTAQVLIALNDIAKAGANPPADVGSSASDFLLKAQAPTGGWGGDDNGTESVEETAVAVEALAGLPHRSKALESGQKRLLELLAESRCNNAAPIGLYFARLWYFEKLYPLIFSVSALGRLSERG